ncbi:MAG: radical SAM protein [Candidatus Aminicenantes bacterium]|nr:radical SAM protein [Candidatus Aminicenantes bacterium]NIM82451.1 radical SAM protein [Candidatus Aminicenantes bacterium]NIN21812.1 radical SAM protein [Candidatus Aminicenantes bacterium]NIN45604.1 radical SAM protein [Candidatus Aminicenantes bacterium]NIN88435.1 radical SAM protein [Candidatus Aminicenantes bacterium]
MAQKKRLCTCGKSKDGPYCDHTHEHKHEPVETETPVVKRKICTCGKSRTPPYCDHSHSNECKEVLSATSSEISAIPGKILLLMPPYWDPLIPPQGIAHLKHYLQHHGCNVKTEDANTREEFKAFNNKYFALLKQFIPEHKQGNFLNIGQDVMRNHILAHINYVNEREYLELVKKIVYETYFTSLSDEQARELKKLMDDFLLLMRNYMLHLFITEKPDVLGLTVLRDTIGPALYAFRFTKEKYPFIMTVMGGSIFSDHLLPGTPNFEHFLEKTPFIDKIIIGEGQELFLKLLQGRLPESQRVFTLEDNDGKILSYTPLNFPDLTDFDLDEDYPYLAAQVSFSCPHQCSFCNVVSYFGKYRSKGATQAVNEMLVQHMKYGSQLFFMNDSLLNEAATGLSQELLKYPTVLYWDGYLRVDGAVCDPDVTLLWRRAGFYRARLGIESGSQRVLDLIHKGITVDQIKTALISLANAGIKTTAYWVIGHPGETEEDFLQTLELLGEIKNYIYEAECNAFIYGFSGQGNSEEWKNKRKLLYPEEAKDMLIVQSWIVDTEPSRAETYERTNRFVKRCKELGIPNPYSLYDIHKADERWRKLHKNAVPPLAYFKKQDAYIDECRNVKKVIQIQTNLQDDGDFGFQ